MLTEQPSPQASPDSSRTPGEPELLAEPAADQGDIDPMGVYPGRAVARLVEAAEGRGFRRGHDAAFAEARRHFERVLEQKLEAQRAELEQERANLIRDTVLQTREQILLAQQGR